MCVGVGGGVECVVGLRESVCRVCIFWGGGDEEYIRSLSLREKQCMCVCKRLGEREGVCHDEREPWRGVLCQCVCLGG